MRIDVHTHFQCLDFVKHLRGRSTLPTSVLDGGTYVIQYAARLNIPELPKIIDMEKKLRDMEDMKIDVAVLSHRVPFGPDVLLGQEADEWTMRINDDLARIIADYPAKFVGLGTVGFGDCQRSIAEVDRCIRKLGFVGIEVFSSISNRLLDSSEFIPVLKHIGMLGVPIHLHPAIPLNRVGLDTATPFLPLGFPYDTSLNTVRLIQSGLFDETPDLKLVVAHVGGVIPYLWGRIEAYNAPSPLVSESRRLNHPIDHYLRKLFVDTVCYHVEALKCCYEVMGAEHLLYGTDHPVGPNGVAAELVEQLNCPASDPELIYHGNAERLFRPEISGCCGLKAPDEVRRKEHTMGKTFALIHGTWHGGWAWQDVIDNLSVKGHRAHAPTLAGHGPGATRLGITHASCVDSVVSYIQQWGLEDVILVGHSFGGTVVQKVAEKLPNHIAQAVFLDALILEHNDCVFDILPPVFLDSLMPKDGCGTAAASSGDALQFSPPPWETWRDNFMQDAPESAAWSAWERLSPEPNQVNLDKLDLKGFYSLAISKSFIYCRQDKAMPSGFFHPGMSSRLGAFKLLEMDGSHEVMFTRPAELADKIIEASLE